MQVAHAEHNKFPFKVHRHRIIANEFFYFFVVADGVENPILYGECFSPWLTEIDCVNLSVGKAISAGSLVVF